MKKLQWSFPFNEMERQDAIDLGASWDDMKAKAGRRVASTIRCMNSWKNVETIEGMMHFNFFIVLQ